MQSTWRQDAVPLFLLTAFPIHIWSYYNVLREFPAWLARLNRGDLIATIGFSQLMPFVESVIVFVPCMLLTLWLARRFDRQERLAIMFIVLLVSTVWSIVFHWTVDSIRHWRLEFIGLLALYLATLAVPVLLILRSKSVIASLVEAIERINVLSAIYIAVDAICLLIVIGYLLI